jgi:hypothetical protein
VIQSFKRHCAWPTMTSNEKAAYGLCLEVEDLAESHRNTGYNGGSAHLPNRLLVAAESLRAANFVVNPYVAFDLCGIGPAITERIQTIFTRYGIVPDSAYRRPTHMQPLDGGRHRRERNRVARRQDV